MRSWIVLLASLAGAASTALQACGFDQPGLGNAALDAGDGGAGDSSAPDVTAVATSDAQAAADGGPADAARVDAGPLACKSSVECGAGLVCCGVIAGGAPASRCQAPCAGPDEVEICDPKAADAGCPAAVGACSSSNNSDWDLPSGYGTCGGRCPGGC